MGIQADCFAVVKATGRLVNVRRPLSFTGSPPLWATSGGEFLSHELHCIGHDWSLPIVLDLLKDGVKIVRTADKWRVV